MIPLSGKLKDDLQKKYEKLQNFPKNGAKKPSLSDCYSCKRFEQGPSLPGNIGKINWCVMRYYDRIAKRSMIHYANIEMLKTCPETVKKR